MRLNCPTCGKSHEIAASGRPFTIPATRCCSQLVARLVKLQGRAVPTGKLAFPGLPPLSAVTTYIR
jgi:hypothetical protein